MLHEDALFALFRVQFAWQVTGGATDAAAGRRSATAFRLPQPIIRRTAVGTAMRVVVVAAQAGIHRRTDRIEPMRSVAGIAVEGFVGRRRTHRPPRQGRLHGRQSFAQAHAMAASQEALVFLAVAFGTDLVVGTDGPAVLTGLAVAAAMAAGAVDAPLGMGSGSPVVYDAGIGRVIRRPVPIGPGQGLRGLGHAPQRAPVARRHPGLCQQVGLAVVLDQKILIQRPVVVEVVATGIGTGGEGHALVAGPLLGDVLMAQPTVVPGLCDAHGVGDGRLVST